MKRCSYCGKEYADGITLCPLDEQPVIDKEAGRTTAEAQPAAAKNTFDAILTSPIASAGTYRVFAERSDFLFIQIEGGSHSILAALAPLLSPVGYLIPLALWLFTSKKKRGRRQEIKQQNPEDLFREGGGNFKLYQAEIRDAALEPASFLATRGKAGRLNLLVRHGEKIEFEFENADEMNDAIHLLAPRLNSTFRINVEWNGAKHRFQKKTSPSPH
jgi:hypothetical protein